MSGLTAAFGPVKPKLRGAVGLVVWVLVPLLTLGQGGDDGDLTAGSDYLRIDQATAVTTLAVGPDGRIASGGQDWTVRIWSPMGEELDNLPVDGTPIEAAFSDQLLVAVTAAGTVWKWPLSVGSPPNSFSVYTPRIERTTREGGQVSTHAPLTAAAVNRESGLVATGSFDGTVRLWTLDGERWGELSVPVGVITALAFSPEGRLLAAASSGEVWVWQLATRETIRVLEGASAPLTFSPDGTLLVAGTEDAVRLWDLASWQIRYSFPAPSPITEAAFHPAGEFLAVGTSDGFVWLWEVETGTKLEVFPAPGEVTAIALSMETLYVGCGGRRPALLFIDLRPLGIRSRLPLPRVRP